jgi:hypothetical protein
MPVHDGSRSNQDERLPPPGPERSQRNPKQLVQGSQSMVRSLRVQSQQLLMESQIFEDEVLAGAESADYPAEEMSERHDHGKNLIEKVRNELCAKSFILWVYDVLARHRDSNPANLRNFHRYWYPNLFVVSIKNEQHLGGIAFSQSAMGHLLCQIFLDVLGSLKKLGEKRIRKSGIFEVWANAELSRVMDLSYHWKRKLN